MKVTLLPETPFLKEDGTFDCEGAINYQGKIAGICYEPEGWSKLKYEDLKKTLGRVNNTLNLEHSTPFEHVNITFEIVNIPKIVAMVLNNEKQCTTSEKSARYTEISSEKEKNITKLEEELYKKWLDILQLKIKEEYGEQFNDSKIKKLAQENARYFVSVFATTKMIHTVPWIQLNRIISFMDKFNQKAKTDFERRLVEPFEDFIKCFEKLNIIDKNALSNRKERSLSLFAKRKVTDEFGYSYATNYKGSFAQLAQAHRHRTIQYNMELLEEKEFFIPPILKDNPLLVKEWQNDMNLVSDIYPQGELVSINEIGSFDMFIGKTKERLCTAAQLEIMLQTKETLLKYSESLQKQNHELVEEIIPYTKGARCTFPDYKCASDCKFKEGKQLIRKI